MDTRIFITRQNGSEIDHANVIGSAVRVMRSGTSEEEDTAAVDGKDPAAKSPDDEGRKKHAAGMAPEPTWTISGLRRCTADLTGPRLLMS